MINHTKVFFLVYDAENKFITGDNYTGDKFATDVNDTGDKFITGVTDTGGKFIAGVNDTGDEKVETTSGSLSFYRYNW